MKNESINEVLQKAIKELSDIKKYNSMLHTPHHGELMPSVSELKELVKTLSEILFPGFFGNTSLKPDTMQYYIGVNIDKAYRILSEQIQRGLCFECNYNKDTDCQLCVINAKEISAKFISTLPQLRQLLSTDVKAAYEGDPAAKSYGEIIFCYPSIKALTNYRIAHQLLKLNVPLIPRIITEMAHSETGIDIHPGAQIGEYFTIDHGTGVVIGETCIIGNHVKIYQGVTLGAKSFPLDENGNPIKGIPRHPIVEDNVIIYAEATILGRVTIGKNSIIGGNVWVVNDVLPNSKVIQDKK